MTMAELAFPVLRTPWQIPRWIKLTKNMLQFCMVYIFLFNLSETILNIYFYLMFFLPFLWWLFPKSSNFLWGNLHIFFFFFFWLVLKMFFISEPTIKEANKESCPIHSILDYQIFYDQTDRFFLNFCIKYKILLVKLRYSSKTFLMKSLKHLNVPPICRRCFWEG